MFTLYPHYLFIMSFVQCLRDPINALPARYPDEFQGRTVALKIRKSVPLTPVIVAPATTSTACGVIIYPSLLQFHQALTVNNTALTTGAGSAIPHDEYNTLLSNMKKWRPVSMGIRVTYTGSNDTSQGEVIIYGSEGQAFNVDVPANSDYSLTVTDWRDYQGAVSQDVRGLGKGLHASVHNFDRSPFFDIGADAAALRSIFPQINVAVTGIRPDDPAFRIETYFNIECVPKPTSVHHDLATVGEHNPGDAMVGRRLASVRVGVAAPKVLAGASGHGPTQRRYGLGNSVGSTKRKRKTVIKTKRPKRKRTLYKPTNKWA